MDFGLQEASQSLITFVRAHQGLAGPIVFVLAFGESLAFVSLALPFFSVLVAIGALIGATHALQFWTVLVAAAIGAALGDWFSYWLGWHYHKQIAAMWPLRNHPNLLPMGERFFARWGAWAVILGRFTGPLRASIPIVAGAAQMPRWIFQIANWSSAFVWAGTLMTVGDKLGKLLQWSFIAQR